MCIASLENQTSMQNMGWVQMQSSCRPSVLCLPASLTMRFLLVELEEHFSVHCLQFLKTGSQLAAPVWK